MQAGAYNPQQQLPNLTQQINSLSINGQPQQGPGQVKQPPPGPPQLFPQQGLQSNVQQPPQFQPAPGPGYRPPQQPQPVPGGFPPQIQSQHPFPPQSAGQPPQANGYAPQPQQQSYPPQQPQPQAGPPHLGPPGPGGYGVQSPPQPGGYMGPPNAGYPPQPQQPIQGQPQGANYFTGPPVAGPPGPGAPAPGQYGMPLAPGQYPRPPGPGGYQPNLPHAPSGPGVPQYPGMPGAGAAAGTKRLDPDQMPSAIGVMQEDQQSRGGVFQTNQRGLLPPLVTTKFLVEDHGNASPRFVRSTMYSIPAQPDMLKQTAVPFAIVVNPLDNPARDEQPISCVDLGPMGPVRCIRCKAYMSPLMQFIDGGRRFQCLLCKATTEVPPEYFQHLDHQGQRVDKWERPELCKGTYEFVATMEYCRNNALPKEPAFIFVLDVSYNNVKSGLVNLLCSHMKSLLENLPSHTPVGFITYNSKVHFYNIDSSLAQPQMVIVPDVADMFMPLLKGFLVPRAEAINAIDNLMNQIPAMFHDTKETDAVLGPAVQAGMEALKASERVGKLLLFHSTLPSSDLAPGKLKNREGDRRLLGTDKEKTVLTPQNTYYNNLGQECVGAGVAVELYLFNNAYIDVATIGQVARLTGGAVNKYQYFQADIDGPRIIGDLAYHLSRPVGFDAVMRVRTSTGVRPTDFHGHFLMQNTTDVELGAIDAGKAIAVEIKHDDKLTEDEGVFIQIALLYTTIFGQRRLRLHNLALNTCGQMADLYRNCELDTIINFLAKQAVSKSIDSTPQAIKEGVIARCAQMLATYRKQCANPSMPGQLILPECLKLLPLYVNCVLKNDAVAGTQELTPDDRSWMMYNLMTMGVGQTVHYFYPKLIPVSGPTAQLDNPLPIRCSRDKLSEDSAYILETGIYLFLWIGASVNPDWLQNIFGVSNLAQLNVEPITELPDVNSDESLRLRGFIRTLRTERQRHMRLTVVRQRDKMELVMNRFLVEDRTSDGHPSYVDFLCHMHKEIRGLLNQ
ncbi:unnamed protein product [Allacma fusca]|uniref:Protein transport protein Sec24C n=1 Tax=Allacma fusca TaxID=39272 RepID=A0A8J2Q2L8_9HEXA|nr:unnamed protein product [Allacma fusca]